MKNKVFDLVIDDINSKGQGVGHQNGLAIFVPGALIGEKVEVRICVVKKSYALGQVVRILKPSDQRVEPKCPFFNSCGGCQLQHMSVKGQLEYKRGRINSAFKRIAKCDNPRVQEVHPSENDFYYRNKVQLPVKMGLKGPCLGFYKRASHEIVEINHCHLHLKHIKPLFDAINHALGTSKMSVYEESSQKGILRHVFIRSTEYTKESVVCFVVTKFDKRLEGVVQKIIETCPDLKGACYQVHKEPTNAIVFSDVRALYANQYVFERVLGLHVKISVGAFFQVNTSQAQKVYQTILDLAGFLENDTVLDAYCGIGTLTLLIAKKVKKVIGVECIASAIEDARFNMALNHIQNAEFKVGMIESEIKDIKEIDCVFLNPPRKGCDVSLLEILASRGVQRLIYMSCDPASLARDMKLLLALGYRVDHAQGFDMFCQTTHVETLLFFSKIT